MEQPLLTEMGMSADLHGRDITKACVRAVDETLHRNSLPGMSTLLDGDMSRMWVDVTLGVPADADRVDIAAVKARFPHGRISCNIVPGGLMVPTVNAGAAGAAPDAIYIVVAVINVGYADA